MGRGGLHSGMGSGGWGSQGSMGRGGMNGRGRGRGKGTKDPNIKVSSVRVNSAGPQVTASVQILSSAMAGTRRVRFATDHGEVTEPMSTNLFTVTKQNTISMGVTS